MAYTDLTEFVRALEKSGELKHVTVPVDPRLEVTGIVQKVLKANGPALLFDNPSRGRMPLLMNLFGTESRMCRALGVASLDEIGDRIAELLKPELPQGIGGFREALGKAAQLRSLPPKHVKKAPCQEVVLTGEQIDLELLPGVQSWPDDTMDPAASDSGYVDMYGMPSRDQVLAHYAEASGRQVDDIDYYVVLAKWKLAVVLEQGFQRAGDDEKLLAFGPVVLDLMKGAAELAETSDYRG